MTRSNTNCRTAQKRRLGVQSLEDRKMMAGDVSLDIHYSGSRMDIELTGDNAGNGVEIRQIGSQLHISGFVQDGAATTIDGYASRVIPMTQSVGGQIRRLDDIQVKMNSGNDRVAIRDVNMILHSHSDLKVETGRGHDSIIMTNSQVARDIALVDHTSDDGYDYVYLNRVTAGDDLDISTGDGNDTVILKRTNVGDELDIDTGRHNDFVNLYDINVDELDVEMGSGNDRLYISKSQADHVDLDGGSGGDLLDVDSTPNNFDAALASSNFETIFS